MKKNFFFIIIIVIISFISGLVSHRFIFRDDRAPVIIRDTIPGDSIFTTVIKDSLIPYKIIEYDTVNNWDTLWKNIDTATLVAEFLKTKLYIDTAINDSSMTVIVKDSISRNTLLGREYYLKNNRETQIINTYLYNQDGIYLGGEFSTKSISLEGNYIYKDNIFEAGIKMLNFDNKFVYVPSFGYKRRLNFKR